MPPCDRTLGMFTMLAATVLVDLVMRQGKADGD